MSADELNLESQISEQDQKTSENMFTVRKIAVGLTFVVFAVGCGLTYAFKDQIFSSKKDTDTVVKLSNLINADKLNANPVENLVVEPVKKSGEPTALNPPDSSKTKTTMISGPVITEKPDFPAASEANAFKNEKSPSLNQINGNTIDLNIPDSGTSDSGDEDDDDDITTKAAEELAAKEQLVAKEKQVAEELAAKEKLAAKELAAEEKQVAEELAAKEKQVAEDLAAKKKQVIEQLAAQQLAAKKKQAAKEKKVAEQLAAQQLADTIANEKKRLQSGFY